MPILLPQSQRVILPLSRSRIPKVAPVKAPRPNVNRNISLVGPQRRVKATSWNESVELFGHAVIYFTLFYCSMNWVYYRGLRKDLEKEQDKK